MHALAEFCKARDIKLVIPFSISGDDVTSYAQIFQVWQSDDKLNNNAIEAFLKRYKDARVVLIDCNDKTSKKGRLHIWPAQQTLRPWAGLSGDEPQQQSGHVWKSL